MTKLTLAQALRQHLPPDLKKAATSLAQLIQGVTANTINPEDLQEQIHKNPLFLSALRQLADKLAGNTITVKDSVIWFEKDTQSGDITIGDIAKQNVIKITLNYQHQQPNNEERESQIIDPNTPMSLREYESRREAVLRLYETYKNLMGNLADVSLKQHIDSIKGRKFNLVVVGEVKAGKSTFINALLGKAVLPTDILQSTSSIIEIVYAPSEYANITYASNPDKVVKLSGNISEVLRDIAAVPDEYRDLPLALLNDFLIEKGGYYKETDIQDLLQAASKHAISVSTHFEHLVRKYVAEHSNLQKIPRRIELGYPLGDELKGIRIVDTPGIHAVGGLQDITFEYVTKADAVVFVHSIQDVEKSHFKTFVDSLTDRARERTFLILTKSGMLTEIEIHERVREAQRIYANISSQHICHVDSVLKSVYDDFALFPTASDLENHLIERQAHFSQLFNNGQRRYRSEVGLYGQKLLLLRNSRYLSDQIDLRAYLLSASNFNRAQSIIYQFASSLPIKQINDVLRFMRESYQSRMAREAEDVALLESLMHDPELFRQQIVEIEQKINTFERELPRFLSELKSEYESDTAQWRTALLTVEGDAIRRLKAAKSKTAFRREAQNTLDALNEAIIKELEGIKERTHKVLHETGMTLGFNFQPVALLKVDVERIMTKAQQKVQTRTPEYEVRREFSLNPFEWDEFFTKVSVVEVGEKVSLPKGQFFRATGELLIAEIRKKLRKIYPQFTNNVKSYYDELSKSATIHIEGRRTSLFNLQNKQQKNDEIVGRVTKFRLFINEASNEIQKIDDALVVH